MKEINILAESKQNESKTTIKLTKLQLQQIKLHSVNELKSLDKTKFKTLKRCICSLLHLDENQSGLYARDFKTSVHRFCPDFP